MKGAVFVDSNIPMYLVGAEHPLKHRAAAILEELIRARRQLVTSSEVLQEICHRFCSINRREFLQPAFDTMRGIVDHIYPVTAEDVEESKALLLGYANLSARDSLHLAVMKNLGIKEMFSFDKDFDSFAWISRVY